VAQPGSRWSRLESSYNELTVLAAKEKTDELSFLAATGVSVCDASLPETRVMGLPAGNRPASTVAGR
jgi:hypothetical protein